MDLRTRVAVCGPRTAQEGWGYAYQDQMGVTGAVGRTGDCLAEFGKEGSSRLFPPLEVRCGRGPKRSCVEAVAPAEDWEFAPPDPTEFPAWARLFEVGGPDRTVRFHRKFTWKQTDEGCAIVYHGVADLDDDGVYATYERTDLIRPDGSLGQYRRPGLESRIEIPEKEAGPIPPLPPELAAHPDLKCEGLGDRDRLLVCGPTLAQQVFDRADAMGKQTYRVLDGVDSCLGTFGDSGSSGYWPAKSVDCVAGPKHACVAVAGEPSESWEFSKPTKDEDPVWAFFLENGLKLPDVPTHFHHRFSWEKKGAECHVSFEAVADLNRDGTFGSSRSTLVYDQSGAFLRAITPNSIEVPEPQ